MNKIALNAMDRHGFMTDHKFAGGDSLNDLRSLYGRIKPSDTDYKSTIQSLIGFNKKDRLSVVNPTSKLVGVADFPRRMADHKPSLDEIRSKAAYKLGLSQNRYSGYGGHSIPSRIETNPVLKDYMSRTKTASADYEEMVKLAYEDIVDGFEKEAANKFNSLSGHYKTYVLDQRNSNMLTDAGRQLTGAGMSGNALHSSLKPALSRYDSVRKTIGQGDFNKALSGLQNAPGKTLADIKASAAAKLGR